MFKPLIISIALCGLILAAVMVGPQSGMDLTSDYVDDWVVYDGAIGARPRILSGCFNYDDTAITNTAGRCYIQSGETLRITKFGLLAVEALGALEDCVFTLHTYQGADVSSTDSSAAGDSIETGSNSDNTGVCSTVTIDAVNETCEVDVSSDSDSVIVGPGYYTVRLTDNAGGGGGNCQDVLAVWLWVKGTYTRSR